MKRILFFMILMAGLALQTGVMAKGQWQYHYNDQPTAAASTSQENGC